MSFSTAEYFGCSLSSCSSGMAPLATAQTPRVIKSANRPRIKTDIKKENEEIKKQQVAVSSTPLSCFTG